jgi:hypothetical protein
MKMLQITFVPAQYFGIYLVENLQDLRSFLAGWLRLWVLL